MFCVITWTYLILQALKTFLEDASSRINRVNPKMESTHTILKKNIYSLQTFVSSPQAKDSSILSYAARDFAYSLARTYMGKLFYFILFIYFSSASCKLDTFVGDFKFKSHQIQQT